MEARTAAVIGPPPMLALRGPILVARELGRSDAGWSGACRRRMSTAASVRATIKTGVGDVHIELDDEAREWIVTRGYDKLYGARPMARSAGSFRRPRW